MTAAADDTGLPLFPPPWFADRLNVARAAEGLPPLGALDGIMMLAWSIARDVKPGPLCLVTGI